MVTAGDFRNGVTFEMDGNVYSIIEFQHVKPGKGAAFVRTKIRNVISGAVTEKTFNPNDKYPTAFIERKDMEYLYNDGDLYYFMDSETYEQLPISPNVLGDNFRFVKENMVCKVLSYKGNVFGIEPPNFVELQVHRDRAGREGRYRYERHEARYAGNRRRDQGSDLHQRRRNDPRRYQNRRVHGARISVFLVPYAETPGAKALH